MSPLQPILNNPSAIDFRGARPMRDAISGPLAGLLSRLFGRNRVPQTVDSGTREVRDLLEQVQSENLWLRGQRASLPQAPSREAAVEERIHALAAQVAVEQGRAEAELVRNHQLQQELVAAQRELRIVSGALKDPKKWTDDFRARREAASDRMHIVSVGPRTRREVNVAIHILEAGATLAVGLRFEGGQELEISFQDGDRAQQVLRTRAVVIRLGRSSDNELVLQDDRVSRAHAALHRLDGRLVLLDRDSANGTGVLSDGTNELVFLIGGSTIRVRPVAP
jgi:hypothetical protein